MKVPQPRITIGRMMVAVAVVALVSTIVLAIPPTIDPLLRERGIRLGRVSYILVVTLLASAIALPWIAAIALGSGAASMARSTGRLPLRRLVAALVFFVVGSTIAFRPLPLDGLRQGEMLDRDTVVAYYNQYRLWPGRHVIPCLEVYSTTGERRTYPIDTDDLNQVVVFRTNADRTVIWVVESPRRVAHHRRKVLCSLDLVTGEFHGTPRPFPDDVEGKSLFPLRH